MIEQTLAQLLASVKHVRTIRDLLFFFDAVLSPQELAQIPKRLECLKRIAQGHGYKKIINEVKVSAGTIARASNTFKSLQKVNPRWWVNFKKMHGVATEEYKDVFAEMGIFTDSNEKRKYMRRMRSRMDQVDDER